MSQVFEIRRLVTVSDTDMVGNANFATFIHWQAQCREEWLATWSPEFMRDLAGQRTMVTALCSVEYKKPAYVRDVIAIRMEIPAAYFNILELNFTYYRVDRGPEQLLAHGEQRVACARRVRDEFEPAGWPEETLRGLKSFGVGLSRVLAARPPEVSAGR